jgi:hypothetical protein
VRSIAGDAIDLIPTCVQSFDVRLVAGASPCSVCSIVGVVFDHNAFDHTFCYRSHVTAHGSSVEAMEHRAG